MVGLCPRPLAPWRRRVAKLSLQGVRADAGGAWEGLGRRTSLAPREGKTCAERVTACRGVGLEEVEEKSCKNKTQNVEIVPIVSGTVEGPRSLVHIRQLLCH